MNFIGHSTRCSLSFLCRERAERGKNRLSVDLSFTPIPLSVFSVSVHFRTWKVATGYLVNFDHSRFSSRYGSFLYFFWRHERQHASNPQQIAQKWGNYKLQRNQRGKHDTGKLVLIIILQIIWQIAVWYSVDVYTNKRLYRGVKIKKKNDIIFAQQDNNCIIFIDHEARDNNVLGSVRLFMCLFVRALLLEPFEERVVITGPWGFCLFVIGGREIIELVTSVSLFVCLFECKGAGISLGP